MMTNAKRTITIFNYFFEIYLSHKPRSEKLNKNKKNSFFCPQFLGYLIHNILPYFPLISGIVIQIYGIRRNSNNVVENWFGCKKYSLEKKIKILIPRLLQLHEETWQGRLNEVLYGLKTTRQLKGYKPEKKRQQMKINFLKFLATLRK